MRQSSARSAISPSRVFQQPHVDGEDAVFEKPRQLAMQPAQRRFAVWPSPARFEAENSAVLRRRWPMAASQAGG